MTFSSLNDIIKSTHAIDAKGGRLPIGIPGRLQIGMHGRLRRYPHAERLIGSIRRECLDHVVVFSERHLRHLLLSYMKYYNRASEHPSVYVVEEKRLC